MENNNFSDADIMQAISEVDGRIATQTYHTKKDRQEAMNIATAYGFSSIVNGEKATFRASGNPYELLAKLEDHLGYLRSLLSK